MAIVIRLVFVAACFAVALRPQFIAGEEPAAIDERSASLAKLTNSMEGFTISAGAGPSANLELIKTPVLRYSDPITTNSFAKVSDGAVFVWTKNGFPEAVTAIHDSKTGRLWVEFLSLSTSPLTATRLGQKHWHPTKSGLEFKPIEDAPIPEKNAPQRMAQMRVLLPAFSASISDQDSARQELRLLSRPALRYAQLDRGILDGAIFVFARSTNPEMLLILEARIVDDKPRWMYSPARFTGRKAEMQYRDNPIWSHEIFPALRNPAEPFFQMFLPEM